MQETAGDMWRFSGQGVLVITTNGTITRDGRAVLGRGCARQAAGQYPDLPQRLGALLRQGGNHVHQVAADLASFPVEETAWSLPDPRLIARSAGELRALADERGWEMLIVPRPGCGHGGLEWGVVRSLLEPHFDGRFLVISTA